MSKILEQIEKENNIREIFLGIFKEDGISKEELEKAICESYSSDEIKYNSIREIPLHEIEEAICETCENAGLEFNTIDDILEYFYKNNNI